MSNTTKPTLPRFLPLANRVVIWLNRHGARLGTIHTLTLSGRVSGTPRSTPVSPLTVDGQRYVIAGLEDADWVANARADGNATLAHGRHREPVRLVEVATAARGPILRAFPQEVPHGVAFFTRLYGVTADSDQFAALRDRCPVFAIEPSA